LSATDLYILYRFFDPAGRLLYIGLTSDPGHRIKQHKRQKSWWLHVARMEVEHCASRGELVEAERLAIKQERPLYNVQGLKVPASKTAVEKRPGQSTEQPPRRGRPHPFDQRLAPPLSRLDVRVFAWLLDRWHGGDRAEPRVRFTLSELGRDIYDRPIRAGERKELQASLHRLGDARSISATWWSRLLAGVGWSGKADEYAAYLSGYTLEQIQSGQRTSLDVVLRAALDSASHRRPPRADR